MNAEKFKGPCQKTLSGVGIVKTTSCEGILIISGLLDPCANIGTEGRFDLLPIPWSQSVFAKQVSKMIECEISLKECIRSQMDLPHFSAGEMAALLRGIGIRAWMIEQSFAHDLITLMRKGYNGSHVKPSEKFINDIAMSAHPFTFRWPDMNPMNSLSIKEFEFMLFSHM